MDEFNPYAAPKTAISARQPEDAGAWRDGNLLAVTKGFDLPDRCLKCNLPTDGWKLKRTLSWHPSGWYLLLLFNIIIYAVVSLIVRHTGKIAVPLCAAHRRSRRRAIVIGWVSALLGFALLVIGASMSQPGAQAMSQHREYPLIGGAVLLLFGILYGILRSQVAVPAKIEKRLIWLKNVHPAFLAELPPFVRA